MCSRTAETEYAVTALDFDNRKGGDMKRVNHLVIAVLATGCTLTAMAGMALAHPARVDPGIDFHMDPKDPDRVIVHEGAQFTTDNFARTFKVDPFTIRALNPEGTIATCLIKGKMKVSPGLSGLELRRSNAIWDNCPEEQRFVFIVPGSAIRLRGELPETNVESLDEAPPPSPEPKASEPVPAPFTAPTSAPMSGAPALPPAPEKISAAGDREDVAALRRDLALQAERIHALEADNRLRTAFLVICAFLMLAFGVLWRNASRNAAGLRRMRHERDEVVNERDGLHAEHARLMRKYDAKTAELSRAQEDLVRANAALVQKERERTRMASEFAKLRDEDLPRAREAIPPAMVSEIMATRTSFDVMERLLGGSAPSSRDLPVGERARHVQRLLEASAARLKDSATRVYMAARLDPPDHEAGQLDFAPLDALSHKIQRFYDSVESQSELLARVAAIPELDGEPEERVRTYAELLEENASLKAQLASRGQERIASEPASPDAPHGEPMPTVDENADPQGGSGHQDIVAALIADPVEETYAPGSVRGALDDDFQDEQTLVRNALQETRARDRMRSAVILKSESGEHASEEAQVPDRREHELSDDSAPAHRSTGTTTMGMAAVSMNALTLAERRHFIGAIDWMTSRYSHEMPFTVGTAVELSAFSLLCKMHVYSNGRLLQLGELSRPGVCESLSPPEENGPDPAPVEMTRKDIVALFTDILQKVTSSRPFEIRTSHELSCLYRLAGLSIRCGHDCIRLFQLSDPRVYQGLNIGKEASG